MLVADASLAVELSLDRLGDQAGSALGGEELVAPCLLWSEVTSVLNEMAFRGEISRELAKEALERFLAGMPGFADAYRGSPKNGVRSELGRPIAAG